MRNSLRKFLTAVSVTAILLSAGCDTSPSQKSKNTQDESVSLWVSAEAEKRADIYKDYTLSYDLSQMSANKKAMISLLMDASKIMDDIYWLQAYGSKDQFPDFAQDAKAEAFFMKNYGPWDRLDGDKAFLKGVGEKPLGANLYPSDMTREEFEAFDNPDKVDLYSLLRRNDAGELIVVPYHEAYAEQLSVAAKLLREAAGYAEDTDFKNYLMMRAEAIVTDDYQASDFAWMDMKNNSVELVIGAIETYEDLLYGYRSAYEAYVLIKDPVWSKRLEKFAAFLPELQRDLPVSAAYKSEVPGSDSDLNAYDVIYYAGHSNAGSKTIAINLPNDEEVQLKKGTRRLQLKNAMRAKFDTILVPISTELIAADQRSHVTFNAFFSGVMFHEVAHGLGIKQTITGKGPVRTALRENASSFEEGKADILGLYMIKKLYEKGELTEGSLMDYYVTFMAGIFRSSRFGASSAHGRANMVRFNYFQEMGAFSQDTDGKYRINMDSFTAAMDGLSQKLLTIQGDGDYEKASELLASKGVISDGLAKSLARLEEANIPVDIHFIQGKEVLGLK